MKLVSTTMFLLGPAFALLAADAPSPLKTTKDKVSYSIGVNIGKNIKAQGAELDPDVIANGIKDVVAGKTPLLTEQEMQETMMAFQTELQAKRNEKQKEAGDKNKKEGEAFLAENKTKEGVKTTASGLQYKIINPGDPNGRKPTSNDTVVTHYRGTLINGTEFDSSYKRGEPATFPVTGVIKGWTEALLMMPVGAKWQLFIPGELAYGPSGRPSIPPNSTLLFDIELLSIKEGGKDGAPSPAPKAKQ